MIRVYSAGVFDLFHVGHIRFFRNAKSLGDYLIIGVHSDKDAEFLKRKPIIPYEERAEIISNIKCVDEVICGPLTKDVDREFYKKHKIDIQCQGNDIFTNDNISASQKEKYLSHYKLPIELGIMKFVEYSPITSTTEIMKKIRGLK